MATRTTLKSYFETGDKPTQTQFEALIDGVPNLTDGSVTDAEFSYLSGTTSAIQTQIDAKQGTITAGTTAQYYRGDKSFQTLDKIVVGLFNVDNTSDANKPVSTATQSALDLKADLTGANFTGAITGNIAITGFRSYLSETTTDRTLSLTDAGTFISAENASGTEVTIPLNSSVAFTAGTEIDFIQKTAGTLVITGDTGVTLNGAVAGSVSVTAQWGGVTIKKIAENEWIAVGKI